MTKLKLLDRLQEEDFAVLRGPFESGRQSPKNLTVALVLCTFIQPLMFFLTYVVAADTTIYPYKDFIMDIHFLDNNITCSLFYIFCDSKSIFKKPKDPVFVDHSCISKRRCLFYVFNLIIFVGFREA